MTDKQTLLAYRLKQAEETLADTEKMLQGGVSGRSIINRAYYVVFYSILALFLHRDINPKTSKHSGVLSIFDRDLVNTGKIDKRFSRIAHRLFNARQEVDYKEFVEVPAEDVQKSVGMAKEFLGAVRQFIEAN